MIPRALLPALANPPERCGGEFRSQLQPIVVSLQFAG